MQSTDLRARIEQSLWPQRPAPQFSTWAVLDLARDPRIHAALLESRLEVLSLYAGRLPVELARVAPHIVELPPGHRLLGRLLDEGWGRSWGIYARIADPTALRHHLRKLLRVRDEAGRNLIFRYYDPRVLRAYLPTCRSDELRAFFGPVAAYLAESDDASQWLEYSFDGRALHTAVATSAG